MVERLELVPSKAIMVWALLSVRSVPLTASVLSQSPRIQPKAKAVLWGTPAVPGLLWPLSDHGRVWWHLGFGTTCQTNQEMLQVRTECEIMLCQALSLFVLSLFVFQRNLIPVSASVELAHQSCLGDTAAQRARSLSICMFFFSAAT